MPNEWKSEVSVPFLNNWDPRRCCNYRGITLNNTFKIHVNQQIIKGIHRSTTRRLPSGFRAENSTTHETRTCILIQKAKIHKKIILLTTNLTNQLTLDSQTKHKESLNLEVCWWHSHSQWKSWENSTGTLQKKKRTWGHIFLGGNHMLCTSI